MTRSPYLTRLAFGRSAYEPPEPQPSGDVEETTASSEATPTLQDATRGTRHTSEYVQQYDERGHPIFPASRGYGRAMRRAQNDVLSAVGVCEKQACRNCSTSGAPASHMPQNDSITKIAFDSDISDEDACGYAVFFLSGIARFPVEWWIAGVRDRLLVYEAPDLPLLQIIQLQYQRLGPLDFFFSGLPLDLFVKFIIRYYVSTDEIMLAADRIVLACCSSRTARNRWDWMRPYLRQTIHLIGEFVAIPLLLQSMAQILQLTSGQRALSFSAAFYPHESTQTMFGQLAAWQFTSETALKCLQLAAPAASLVLYDWSRTYLTTNPAWSILPAIVPWNSGKGSSEPWHEYMVGKILNVLGWGTKAGNKSPLLATQPVSLWEPSRQQDLENEEPDLLSDVRGDDAATEETATQPQQRSEGTRARTATVLEPVSIGNLRENNDNSPPRSPEATTNEDPADARIRIASQDSDQEPGVVNLEIELPEPPSHRRRSVTARVQAGTIPYLYRITSLTETPTDYLAGITIGGVTGMLLLPLRALALRHIAYRRLQTDPYAASAAEQRLGSMLRVRNGPLHLGATWSLAGGIGLRAAGALVQKVVLCEAIKLALGLTMWHCQYGVVTWLGKKFFGWGGLSTNAVPILRSNGRAQREDPQDRVEVLEEPAQPVQAQAQTVPSVDSSGGPFGDGRAADTNSNLDENEPENFDIASFEVPLNDDERAAMELSLG